MRVYIRGEIDEKPVNIFNFGAIVSNFMKVFPDDLPLCDKVKSIIDYQFENHTKKYLYK